MSKAELRVLYKAGSGLAGTVAPLIYFHIITPAEAINITLIFFLVLITATYAKRTAEIAKETREQRLALARPRITLRISSSLAEKYFVKTMEVDAKNEGPGLALNMELYVDHPLFKFSKHGHPYAISVGETANCKSHVEEPNPKDDPGIPIDPIALVIANYEDCYTKKWHSILPFHWDAKNKTAKPKRRMRVAMPGPYKRKG